MSLLALVCAGLSALLHVFIFRMESLTWTQPSTWRRFGLESQAAAETTRALAYNQGFYNLFLAIGTGAGVALVALGHTSSGFSLLLFGCGSMLSASLVLLSSGRRYARAATTQGLFPLLAVSFAVLALRG